jgi:hypothetical protein
MSAIRIAIMGAGSVRCTVPVLTSLAHYFGERPLQISLFDADAERLDLFDRFARVCFTTMRQAHSLRSTEDATEALEDAEFVVFQVDENCARKFLSRRRHEPDPTDEALERLTSMVPEGAQVLSLAGQRLPLPSDRYECLEWPPMPTAAEEAGVPHSILRLLNQEDYPYELLRRYEQSPLKEWLNSPSRSQP